MSGVSYGEIQTLVSAEKIPGVRGYIPKGAPNQAKLYPAFGADDDHRKGHGPLRLLEYRDRDLGTDVMSFIDAVLKR